MPKMCPHCKVPDPGICDGKDCPLGGHSHCMCAHPRVEARRGIHRAEVICVSPAHIEIRGIRTKEVWWRCSCGWESADWFWEHTEQLAMARRATEHFEDRHGNGL